MSADAPERDYEVGYGKTPMHTRFQPGHTGNPRGRKKGSKNGRVLLAEELNQLITFTENGKRITKTKLGLIMKRAVNDAVNGKPKAYLDLYKAYGPDAAGLEEAEVSDPPDSPEDVEDRETLFRRIRGKS